MKTKYKFKPGDWVTDIGRNSFAWKVSSVHSNGFHVYYKGAVYIPRLVYKDYSKVLFKRLDLTYHMPYGLEIQFNPLKVQRYYMPPRKLKYLYRLLSGNITRKTPLRVHDYHTIICPKKSIRIGCTMVTYKDATQLMKDLELI